MIMWMDHRAVAQARRINATAHPVLRYVGGIISPEMQTPKLLWLKTHRPSTFAQAKNLFDLADYLTFRATGSLLRSICTVTCKWTYLAHERRWDASYFEAIDLGELISDNFRRIGAEIVEPGTALGQGLSVAAATAFGLAPGTPVGAALIDAHAGGLGTIGGLDDTGTPAKPSSRLAYIMGTSACIMATTREPCFVPGVWGPYYSAMVPGSWLNEGGQSAAGTAIDFLVASHPAHAAVSAAAGATGTSLLGYLEGRIAARAGPLSRAALLARDIHVLPDFLGNRSPFADPDVRGAITGLDLDQDEDSLERLFVAGLCGVGYALAEVVDALRAADISCATIVMSGGASRSALTRQLMADATGLSVALPATDEPVLLGAAMLGAVAGGAFTSVPAAMAAMSRIAGVVEPAGGAIAAFHGAKREVFTRLRRLDRETRELMRPSGEI